MTKLVQLTLSQIKYAGDSIGDDIRIEIDCLNHSLDFGKTIKNKSETRIDKTVGGFFTNQSSFSLPLSARVIERDLIFNDVGATEQTFAVDTRIATPQQFTLTVEVLETRNYTSKKKAKFEIMFEARIVDATAYIAFTEQGWFTGKYTATNKRVDLVSHLQVRIEQKEAERDYFQVMEGPHRGKRVSLAREKEISHFESENPETGPVHLIYSLSKKTIAFGGQVYKVREYKDDPDPWQKGFHDIEIADYSHDLGRPYLNRAALALVWFRVNHHRDNERYLHVGAVSLGCITLTEVERWDALCKILLKARKGDGRNIGIVEVVD